MGKAFLVGAGPGDPELITVKALKCIQAADVILYDRLVNAALLEEAKKGCQLIYCGKQPGHHTMNQETINDLLVKFTEKDKIVVRLKGGDPFVFGRGAEEAEALVNKGLPFEVVPGITAGLAAPAHAGIPITHRDLGSSFAVVTGHCQTGLPVDIDWKSITKAVDTIVVYMGIRNLPYICQELLYHGKNENTPVAVIQEGTTVNQRTIIGMIKTIAAIVENEGIKNPAIIVIGEVVRYREKINKLECENRLEKFMSMV